MTTSKPLAYSYRRFSHIKQNAEGSLRRQKDIAVEYCEKNNLQLVDDVHYTFLDRAKSAYRGKNATDDTAELHRFYQLVKAESIPVGSYLIVESLDRLSREHPRQALPRFLDLINAGINIVSVNDNKVYTGQVQELDLIVSIMEMSRSHRESHHKSIRVSDAWRDKQEDARTGKPMGATKPAWLDAVYRDEDKDNLKKKPSHYVVNEAKKKIVQDIFQWTLGGYGREAIAKKLNEAGVPSFKNKTWGGSSVAQILKSPTVIGVYQPCKGKGKERVKVGEAIKGLYEPIIDETTFYDAQRATKARHIEGAGKQSSRFNVWQGILKCAKCGAALHQFNKEKGQRLYLQCYEARKRKCDAKPIRMDRSEDVFKQLLTKVNSMSLVQSDARSLEAQLNETVGRIDEQQRLMKENLEFLRTRASTAIRTLVADCEDEIARLDKRQEELEQALAMDSITNKEDFFARLDVESYEGRAKANELLKRLTILVTVIRGHGEITYQVYKKEQKILVIADNGVTIDTSPYDADVAMAMYRQGELKEHELEINVGFSRKYKKPGKRTEIAEAEAESSGEPIIDWASHGSDEYTAYDHDDYDQDIVS
jgi:DNA invertase Pin-like site-specific DNA recombinase